MGTAGVFVICPLDTPLHALMDALAIYLADHRLSGNTKFWVRDLCARNDEEYRQYVRACVEMIGNSVLLLDPWDNPRALLSTECVVEVHATLRCGGRLDCAMSSGERGRLMKGLAGKDVNPAVGAAVDKMDVRNAIGPTEGDREAMEREVEAGLGLVETNEAALEQVRETIIAELKGAVDALPAEERATSALINSVCKVIELLGDLEGSRPLSEEMLEGRRRELGVKHKDTLIAMHNVGVLLVDLGDFARARDLFQEALPNECEVIGPHHWLTLNTLMTLGRVLLELGDLKGARRILQDEALPTMREKLGPTHPYTLFTTMHLGRVRHAMGAHTHAKVLLEEAVPAWGEVFGSRNQYTLECIHDLGALLRDMGQLDRAKALLEEALTAMREVQGSNHKHAIKYMRTLSSLLILMGDSDGARALSDEADKNEHAISVRSALKRALRKGARRWGRTRLMVVGQGGAGKVWHVTWVGSTDTHMMGHAHLP